MNADGLFHISPDGQLASMTVTPYEAEAVLQELLETHPDLLAGGQMTPEAPRRWALVKREQGVPDRDDAGYRWSIDHLFVDQDAVPTLVEVKRSTDTRIRREIVGQMLDYAANGVRYWPVEALRVAYETTQREMGYDPEERLRELCEVSTEVEEFFAKVGDNLRVGRIRMVFVADVIPQELKQITEFLNEQMSPAEVFAVEVKQYRAAGHDSKVIVPAVYGRTATASAKNSTRRTPDRAEAVASSKPSTIALIDHLDGLAEEQGLVVQQTPAGNLIKTSTGRSIANIYLASWDSIEVPLQPLRDRGWSVEANRLHARLSLLTTKKLTVKNPTVPSEEALALWTELREMLIEISHLYNTEASLLSEEAT